MPVAHSLLIAIYNMLRDGTYSSISDRPITTSDAAT
jgi:hypothetical protein